MVSCRRPRDREPAGHGRLGRMQRPFSQVDVFSQEPFGGNPVAVVLDGTGLTRAQMQLLARWTNLSERVHVQRSANLSSEAFPGYARLGHQLTRIKDD